MITTGKYIRRCSCRSVGECNHNIFAEDKALEALVNAAARAMKVKLIASLRQGRHGWDDPKYKEDLYNSMVDHVLRGKGQYLDVANLAIMLWNLEQLK